MNKIITILGPTASGKTKLATHLAYNIDAEIISADSRQVYKYMNIGTGKDLSDYIINDIQINYHLIDIKEPGYKYNVYEYQQDFISTYNLIKNKKKQVILCGGSGMYIDAALNNYNLLPVSPSEVLRQELEKESLGTLIKILSNYKQLHNTTDITSKKRVIRAIEIAKYYEENPDKNPLLPNFDRLLIGIVYTREHERVNIKTRLESRLKEGMIEEVENLMRIIPNPDNIIYYGLEYKFITMYIMGKLTFNEMFDKLYIAICQFAKRQRTWFRKMEREGNRIEWIEGEKSFEEKLNIATALTNSFLRIN